LAQSRLEDFELALSGLLPRRREWPAAAGAVFSRAALAKCRLRRPVGQLHNLRVRAGKVQLMLQRADGPMSSSSARRLQALRMCTRMLKRRCTTCRPSISVMRSSAALLGGSWLLGAKAFIDLCARLRAQG
jgi:hypothetical protein